MLVTSKLSVDLEYRDFTKYLYATQNDSNTRAVEITLLSNNTAWPIPAGVTGAVSFKKPDKTSGLYDVLPDGVTKAVTFESNKVTAILAPQVLTAAGDVFVSIVLFDENLNRLGTFPITLRVAADPSSGQNISSDYYAFRTLEDINKAISNMQDYANACFLPSGKYVSISSVEDLDGIQQNGAFRLASDPQISINGIRVDMLICFIHNTSGVITQLALSYNGHIQVRSCWYNTWYPWKEIYTSENKPTPAEIGAALAGYGYGETLKVIEHNSEASFEILLNNELATMADKQSKQIAFSCSGGLHGGATYFGTLTRNIDGYAVLYGCSAASAKVFKSMNNGVWSPFEWVNPLMAANVEYRTTERWLGRAVYTKVMNVGAFPAEGSRMHFELFDLPNVRVLRVSGNFGNKRVTVPYVDGESNIYISTTNYEGATYIVLYVEKGNFTDDTCIAQIWYTKD